MFASEIIRKRVQQLTAYSKWKWPVRQLIIGTNGTRHYLRRAVDHKGQVFEAVATSEETGT